MKKLILILTMSFMTLLAATQKTFAWNTGVVGTTTPNPDFLIVDAVGVSAAIYPIMTDNPSIEYTSYKVIELTLDTNYGSNPVTWYSTATASSFGIFEPVIAFISFDNENYQHDDIYSRIGNKNELIGYGYATIEYSTQFNFLGGGYSDFAAFELTGNSNLIFVFEDTVDVVELAFELQSYLNAGRIYNGTKQAFYRAYMKQIEANDRYDEGYDAGYDEGYDIGYGIGYDIGYDDGWNAENDFWPAFWGSIAAPFQLFEVEIFPGVTFGMIAMIPIVFGLLGFILNIGGKKQ